jgi:hypothetical protein
LKPVMEVASFVVNGCFGERHGEMSGGDGVSGGDLDSVSSSRPGLIVI